MTSIDTYIYAAKRTAIANFQGELSTLSATDLGASVIKDITQQIQPEQIDACFMGCVLPAGLGQAPARQVVLQAGLPQSIHCTTVNKVCGSGMQAVMFAVDSIRAGSATVVIAGGMESMSNAPYLLPKARRGYRLGHQQAIDHLFLDGLEDAYNPGKLMGVFAETCASDYAITRHQQDDFTLQSLQRAQAADFTAEITPVQTKTGTVDRDECPRVAKPDKIPQLKPVFKTDGTITAANASAISDGAAALLIAREGELQLPPLAKIVAHSTHSQSPEHFTTAPIKAISTVLAIAGWHQDDVDLYEINEAFAVVTLAAIKSLGLDSNKVNVNGGACALGHPLGATGARIIVTLLHALQQRGLKRGIAALCIGGGEATAIAIERCTT